MFIFLLVLIGSAMRMVPMLMVVEVPMMLLIVVKMAMVRLGK